jgi:LPS-assembly lipoprotein
MWWRDGSRGSPPPCGEGSGAGVERPLPVQARPPSPILPRNARGRLIRFAAAALMAGAVAGCFQPLYGDRSATGGVGLRDMMAAVEIEEIAAPKGTPLSRIAVEVQNELRFGLTGGSGAAPPTHRLTIKLFPNSSGIIVDRTTGRQEFVNLGLDANYTLIEIATKKPVMSANAVARVTYDIPGQEQRFLAARGKRDAESQAAKLIAEQIRNRLASYFVAGT